MIAATFLSAWLALSPEEIDRANEQFSRLEASTEASIAVPAGQPALAAPGRSVRLFVRLKNDSESPLKFDVAALEIVRDGLGGGKPMVLKPLFPQDDAHLRQRLAARKLLLERLKLVSDEELPDFLLLHFPQLEARARTRERAAVTVARDIEALAADLKVFASWRDRGEIAAGATLELAFRSELPPGFDQNAESCRLTLRLTAPGGQVFNLPALARVE